MIISTILLSAIYSTLILLFMKGWKRIPTFHFREHARSNVEISVVIACKNEAKNLPNLLQSLKNQSYQNFELVLIDDNSTDETWQIMQNASSEFHNIKVFQSLFQGKKKALKMGIEHSDNEFIITTDADCTPTPCWIVSIVTYQQKTKSDLIIGPVAISPASSFFERLQQLEFLSLISSGAAAVGLKQPIMCNGANLAFKKEIWLKNYLQINENQNSGDDVFILHALKKQYGKINFLKSTEAIVYTNACKTISSFCKQRKRWASKAPAYTDLATIIVALIVFSVSVLQVILLIAGIFKPVLYSWFLVLATIKLTVDILFLQQTSSFFEQKISAKTLIPLVLIYPFYIVITSISGIYSGEKQKYHL